MNTLITFEAPTWYILLCIVTGILYSGALYFRSTHLKEASAPVKWIASVSRAILVSIIAFLLLSPLLKHQSRRLEKPILALAMDNSRSILLSKDSTYVKNELKSELEAFTTSLSEKFEINTFSFGEIVQNKIRHSYSDKLTNYEELIDRLKNEYTNRNLGAAVIVSDGIYNIGRSPVSTATGIQAPIYTVALGDTTERKDLILNNTFHNNIAFLGNKFPVQVNISALDLKNEITSITIKKDGKVIAKQPINISTYRFSTQELFELDATKKGLQRYTVELAPLSEEANYDNNSQEFYINVLDSRQKILLVYGAPHPDIAALSSSIQQVKTFELSKVQADAFDQKSFQQFDLIIAHGLNAKQRSIFEKVQEANIPTFLINTNFPQITNGVKISLTNNRTNEAEPVLNQNFSLFTLTDNIKDVFKNAPAAVCPFGNYQISQGFHTLLYQKIGQVTTQSPMLGFNTSGTWKTATLFADGLWRWKLNAYANTNSNEAFNEFIQKTISFLSLNTDKSYFRVTGKRTFAENESIELLAEVYNQSYELINTPEVKITITDSLGQAYDYAFSRSNNSYKLNAGFLASGPYSYTANVKVNDKTYYKKGSFSVTKVMLESLQLTANHQLLHKLSYNTGGKLFYPGELDALKDSLLSNDQLQTISYLEQSFEELINVKALFFFLISLLTLEWFLRKYNGAY